MNLKQIQELIKFVAKSGATEVDLEMGDVKICIKSPPKGKIITDNQSEVFSQPQSVPPASVPPASVPLASTPPVLASSQDLSKTELEDPVKELSSTEQIIIKSPIIGTFYRRPSPDKDPFVNVGDKIDLGSVVGIVEAMKLFNEIESEVSGTIVKVLVEDMSPVE
ncbi:MAG: acetyl-CoA carboxylase biotin carboxyl carrier protein, partial [Candidatus Marinimicrobia bacterium]|nr:acetyl-CoA carboxylase biotin carboxyl carrier protein [Candidatus Neomarinimicrobiota bacterium]